MAVNKDPFVYSKNPNGPDKFKGLVQAGSTQAIKIGEICCFDKTTGYWIPVSAVADSRYMLAIAAEEQKASSLGEYVVERYLDFYSLDPADVFEFVLDAARSLAIGDTFTLTASDSQKLTYGSGDYAVAMNIDGGHYPEQNDTTIRNQSYARVVFNPRNSYWGLKRSLTQRQGRRVISTAVDLTLKETECYNTLILVTAAKTITLPAVKPGMDLIVMSTGANAVHVDPNASDKIRLYGAQLDNGDKLSSASAAGDAVRLIHEDADGWCHFPISGTWTDGS